ncbi:MAG TPA: 2Fe-2S iron-sulfur cluster binding domain-containing protein [Polyangiales bacterium]
MPTITVLPSGKTADVSSGTSLLAGILATGEPLKAVCAHGEGCRGECHVFVHDGRKTLSKTQRAENEQLDTIVGVGSKSRLACQATIGGENVTVELLGFASG